MAYDEGLAERVRKSLQDQPNIEEKNMFGGVCFMAFAICVVELLMIN